MYVFSFKNGKKVGEKACFYTKQADLSFENCYKNQFFFQPNSQAKILSLQKKKENVCFQLQKW